MKYDIGIDLCRILFSQLREDSNLNSFHKGELYKIGILKKKKKKKPWQHHKTTRLFDFI